LRRLASGFDNQSAISRKANPNKTKQNGFHLLFGIETFQRVMAEKNKNFPLLLGSRGRLCRIGFQNSRKLSSPAAAGRLDFHL
jgi:hypothetical protein